MTNYHRLTAAQLRTFKQAANHMFGGGRFTVGRLARCLDRAAAIRLVTLVDRHGLLAGCNQFAAICAAWSEPVFWWDCPSSGTATGPRHH